MRVVLSLFSQAIGAHAQRILELDPPRRSVADHAFVQGLLKTRNDVRDKLCKSWPAHQFGVLCKRIKMQKFIPFKKVLVCCLFACACVSNVF